MTRLPNGWQLSTLGAVARWGSGGTPRAGDPRYYGGSIPWAVIGDLADGPVPRTAGSITAEGLRNSSAKVVPPGAVLIAMYGSIGKLGLTTFELTTNQAIAFAVPHPELIETKYLFYYLLSQRGQLASAGKGATQLNIGQGVLKAWPVPLPPLQEQRRIVEILEDHVSRLDAATGDVGAAAGRLDVLRAQVLNNCLVEAESSPGLELHASLGSLVSPGRKLAYGVLVPGPHVEGGVPLVRVGDLRRGQVRLSELKTIAREISDGFPRTLLRGGELLLSLVGTIGRTGVAPSALADANVARAVGVLPLREGVDARFVSLLLEAPRSNRALNGLAHEVARKTLNLEDVKSFELPIPSLDAQLRIVAAAEEALSAVRRLEVAATTTKSRTSALRRAMLSAAFSGRLTRRSADLDHPEELARV